MQRSLFAVEVVRGFFSGGQRELPNFRPLAEELDEAGAVLHG